MNVVYKIASISQPMRFYIGSSIDYQKRKREHLRALKKGTHHSVFLQNHVNKYGILDLRMDPIEYVEGENNLIEREQFYIDSLNPCFNICRIAGRTTGIRPTAETLAHLSEVRKGRIPWNKGKKDTLKHSPAFREMMRKKMKGRTSPMKGRHQSESSKKKQRIPILQFDRNDQFIREWKGQNFAAKELGIPNMNAVLQGKRKTAGNFKWKYK